MDYKDTLNLPQTDFPMKANLNQREPLVLEQWEKMGLYELLRLARRGAEKSILHDGPPYANGRIHIGHALNKILKDIIVRYWSLRGFDAPYIPGWDCHGLPVEHQLFKDLKKDKHQIDRVEFRRLAHDYAMKYVALQRDEFKRLGIIGDWAHPYLTLDKKYEQGILGSFAALVEKGYVYRGLKPVNWCFRCETALAEAEVEYEDHESDSVFVKFPLKPSPVSQRLGLPSGDNAILIWTTTPWTLLANVAVAVHPDFTYILVAAPGSPVILNQDLFESSLKGKLGLEHAKVLLTCKGRDLEGLVYAHPFVPREGRVVLADYVSREDGSGCVHTAPGHGQEDFMTGTKYGLDVIMPVNERGRFDETSGVFAGQHVFDANALIIEKLKDVGALMSHDKVRHTYPHCWRCKKPIIFRATQQWFLKIDHDGLRSRLLQAIKKDVTWVPASGQERIAAMVAGRPDWCLSRQRYWGVPIPAVICTACHKHTLDASVIRNLSKRVADEGTDAWFKADVKEFLPSGFKCSCGGDQFERSTDILDVWFDSGVSHQAVLKGAADMKLPADLYLEGSDQHRGWFQASLIPSMAIDGHPPFKAVLTHGFVVDGEGRKMSKSLGNVVAPQEITKDFGADILRLWVLSSDYNDDVRISKEILNFTADAYRKIRNTARFLLGNLSDFDPAADRLPVREMLEIDRGALFRLRRLVDDVTRGYEEYRFYHVFQRLFAFCNEEMSSLYLDILKDRLYTAGKKSAARRSAQTALYEILRALTKMLAPVVPFTAEEIFRSMKKETADAMESVHLCLWPELSDEIRHISEKDVAPINAVLSLRPVVLKALETKRATGDIGSPLEAAVTLSVKDKALAANLRKHAGQLPFIFIVSQVTVVENDGNVVENDGNVVENDGQAEALEVSVSRAQGQKCQRCWNYTVDVGAHAGYPGVCGRCVEAIAGTH